MKITLENFKEVRKKASEVGIDKVQYGPNGEALSFTTKDGQQFEFDPSSFEDFKHAGLIKLGVRRENPK